MNLVDFDVLKANSIDTTRIKENSDIELPVDRFLMEPSPVYVYSLEASLVLKNYAGLKISIGCFFRGVYRFSNIKKLPKSFKAFGQ